MGKLVWPSLNQLCCDWSRGSIPLVQMSIYICVRGLLGSLRLWLKVADAHIFGHETSTLPGEKRNRPKKWVDRAVLDVCNYSCYAVYLDVAAADHNK